MTRIVDTPKALLVEVPEGATEFRITNIQFDTDLIYVKDGSLRFICTLPTGSYGQPILASEMREEDLLNILEFWDSATGGENYMNLFHFTCPEESFASLLSSHNLKPETTVVITKL